MHLFMHYFVLHTVYVNADRSDTFILADKICLSAYRSGSSLHIHTRKELQSVLYRVEQTFIHKLYFIVYLELLLVANKSIFHFTDIPSTCL